MMIKKGKFLTCGILCLLALSITASAAVNDPNIISGAVTVNGTAPESPEIVRGGLSAGVESHVDRTYVILDTAHRSGIDFVKTMVDDKNDPDVEYQITVNKSGTLYLLIDNRVGDDEMSDPPTLDSVMTWVDPNFTQSDFSIVVSGSPDVTMTAYEQDVSAGTYTLHEQYDGTSRVTYLVAAVPDNFNYPPEITDVDSSYQVVPGGDLFIDANVIDYYGENVGIASYLWEQLDPNVTVSFSPDAASEDVTITFPEEEGVCTIQLTATDNDGGQAKKTIEVSVQIPQFAVEAANWVEACNDVNRGPTSHWHPTEFMYMRNHSAPRRRIQLISYDVSGLKEAGEVFANSYLTLQGHKCSGGAGMWVYGINEDLDNFDLDTGSWSNLPGVTNTPVPPMEDPVTYETHIDKLDVSPLLLFDPSTPNNEWSDTDDAPAGLDEFLNADVDGTILLLFATFSPEDSDLDIFARDEGDPEPVTGLGGIILRGNVLTPTWATNPIPQINTDKSIGLFALSWTKPTGVGNITCDVYIGIGEPNYLEDDYGYDTLATGISGSLVSLLGYTLTADTTYNWIVDCTDDGTGQKTRGYLWSFNAIDNIPPAVEIADPLKYLWLNNNGDPASATAVIDATVTDDGVPVAASLLWEQTSGPVTVTIDPNNVEDITLTLPATGTYTFRLTADDTEQTGFASTEIFVGETPCEAAQAKPGYTANIADFNDDCYVDLLDFATFALQWLECHPFMDAPCAP